MTPLELPFVATIAVAKVVLPVPEALAGYRCERTSRFQHREKATTRFECGCPMNPQRYERKLSICIRFIADRCGGSYRPSLPRCSAVRCIQCSSIMVVLLYQRVIGATSARVGISADNSNGMLDLVSAQTVCTTWTASCWYHPKIIRRPRQPVRPQYLQSRQFAENPRPFRS